MKLCGRRSAESGERKIKKFATANPSVGGDRRAGKGELRIKRQTHCGMRISKFKARENRFCVAAGVAPVAEKKKGRSKN